MKNNKTKSKKEERLNEKRIMNCGVSAEIINYNNANDIDVRFEDGIIVKHKQYRNFDKGSIRHPDFTDEAQATERIGEKRYIPSCKMYAEIIKYENTFNIDVKFDDGTIVTHRCYSAFKKGLIGHPKFTKQHKRIGKKRLMHNNEYAVIIEYRNANDIDVEFVDSKVVVYHKKYSNFKNRKIGYSKTQKRKKEQNTS